MKNSFVFWISIINILFAFQGLFLAFNYFIKSNSRSTLTFHVGMLMTICSMFLLNTFFALNNEIHFESFTQPFSNMLMLAIGPSLYVYLRATIDEKNITAKAIWHYVPFFAVVLLFFILERETWEVAGMFMGFSQLGIYLYICLRLSSKNLYSLWIRPMLIAFTVVFVINLILKLLLTRYEVHFLIPLNSTLLFGIPIFWISYRELNQTSNFFRKANESNQIDAERFKKYIAQIESAMNKDHLYRNPNLSVKIMARQLEIPINMLSQVVNTHYDRSFPDFVNSFRLEEVKRNLLAEEFKRYTILGIAEISGFKSGSRFNTLFKKHVGMTPSEFRKTKQLKA
ncbi:helix-turn-helix domain-containing protein [Flagellimonas sp. S174]|uniref:AraC family transcriptional regulator n=1 Tax=Flagellimonas sp. S174 TaxID=3410790 RepID=UPI003BF61D81